MANAFLCDACGEYADGEPTIIIIIQPSLSERVLRYELCPFCANDVIETLKREKPFSDLEQTN